MCKTYIGERFFPVPMSCINCAKATNFEAARKLKRVGWEESGHDKSCMKNSIQASGVSGQLFAEMSVTALVWETFSPLTEQTQLQLVPFFNFCSLLFQASICYWCIDRFILCFTSVSNSSPCFVVWSGVVAIGTVSLVTGDAPLMFVRVARLWMACESWGLSRSSGGEPLPRWVSWLKALFIGNGKESRKLMQDCIWKNCCHASIFHSVYTSWERCVYIKLCKLVSILITF